MNRENEIFEKEMLGKSLREMFFELNVETEDRFQKIKDDFLKINILGNTGDKDIFIETVLADKNEVFKLDGVFFPVIDKLFDKMNTFDDSYKNIYLEDVYLNVEFRKISDIADREFLAWIDIEEANYELKVVLEKYGKR